MCSSSLWSPSRASSSPVVPGPVEVPPLWGSGGKGMKKVQCCYVRWHLPQCFIPLGYARPQSESETMRRKMPSIAAGGKVVGHVLIYAEGH